MNNCTNIIFAFSYFLGLFAMLINHGAKISKKVDGWGYSIFIYIGFLIMVISAALSQGQQIDGAKLTIMGWTFRYVFAALMGTMFSVLAFYIISTAYRSFRIKSSQALVLFLAAFIIILAKVPLGHIVWDSVLGWTGLKLSAIMEWIMGVPAVSAKRGILIGIAVGAIATSLKILFGIERQYLGKD